MKTNKKFKNKVLLSAIVLAGLLFTAFLMIKENHNEHPDHTESEQNQTTATQEQYDGQSQNENEQVSLTPRQQQLIGMEYDTVKVRPLERSFRTVGFLNHAEPNLSEIVPRVSGYIEEVYVGETGVHVMKGQDLLEIYSPELVSSQEDYLIALRRGNEEVARRARERLKLLYMQEEEIKRLEEKMEPLIKVKVKAPSRGHVMIMNVKKGMEFKPGDIFYRLNDHSRLWLHAEIYEDDLPFVEVGQEVEFEVEGRPGKNRTGVVSFMPPMANAKTRTIPVRIEVSNPDFSLKMNQYARVDFNNELGDKLTVHKSAVLRTGLRDVVFVETGKGRFEPVEVHLGLSSNEYYEVLHGLKEGDRVVTSGRFWLDAESRLRGSGMSMDMDMMH